jgi:hypothetical protein
MGAQRELEEESHVWKREDEQNGEAADDGFVP